MTHHTAPQAPSRAEIAAQDGRCFPGRSYAEAVLSPIYESAKHELLGPMMAIHRAHLVMLAEQGLVDPGSARKILAALESIDLAQVAASRYDGRYEDLFFYVEDLTLQAAGEEAGNLHIARSRNDMGVTMYRMVLRKHLLDAIEAAQLLHRVLLRFAAEEADTVMLAHTHTQQAQPTTLGHWLTAAADVLERDIVRLQAAYQRANRSPMGAAALSTSGFPISRERVAELLGFDGLVENSYDAIAGADYVSEAAAAAQLAALHTGRMVQDLLTWCTQEYGVLRVADPYVQTSSIMPQKRNPVSLEHARALLSSSAGRAQTVLQMLHNTPFGDIVDTEDEMQPNLWAALATLRDVFRLLANVLGTAEVSRELLLERARASFANVTELADLLVREAGLPFRTAHSVVAALVKAAEARGIRDVRQMEPRAGRGGDPAGAGTRPGRAGREAAAGAGPRALRRRPHRAGRRGSGRGAPHAGAAEGAPGRDGRLAGRRPDSAGGCGAPPGRGLQRAGTCRGKRRGPSGRRGGGPAMTYYLAVDGGGTKCLAVLVHREQGVVGSGLSGGSNPQSVGREQAVQALTDAVRAACRDLPPGCRIDTAAFGLAGVDTPASEEEARRLAQAAAGCGRGRRRPGAGGERRPHRPAGRRRRRARPPGGVRHRIGGLRRRRPAVRAGRRLGAPGGRRGQCLSHRPDGPVQRLPLAGRRRTGHSADPPPVRGGRGRDLYALYDWLYLPATGVDAVAGLARAVDAAAQAGDPAAGEILARAGRELGGAAALAARRAGLPDGGPFPVFLLGGVLQNSPAVRSALLERLAEEAPGGVVQVPRYAPIYGAVMRALGGPAAVDEGLRRRLLAADVLLV